MPRKTTRCLEKVLLWSQHFGQTNVWELLEKTGPYNHEDPSDCFLQVLNGINIFQKTWNGFLVIWDHWNFGTLEFATKNLLKPRNQETKIKKRKKHNKPKTKKTFNLSLFSGKGIPTTPQHTDPHTSLWGFSIRWFLIEQVCSIKQGQTSPRIWASDV